MRSIKARGWLCFGSQSDLNIQKLSCLNKSPLQANQRVTLNNRSSKVETKKTLLVKLRINTACQILKTMFAP